MNQKIEIQKITSEMEDIMNKYEHCFARPKQVWTGTELKEAVFALINLYDGTNKQDLGCNCGGQRTNAVNRAKLIYNTWKGII